MSGVFSVVIVIALIAVLGALGIGILSMTKGGSFNAKYSNKLMRLRIILQFTALALIVLAFLLRGD